MITLAKLVKKYKQCIGNQCSVLTKFNPLLSLTDGLFYIYGHFISKYICEHSFLVTISAANRALCKSYSEGIL